MNNVVGDITYTATYSEVVNEYTITFKNGDDVLQSGKVAYGATPVYNGATPVKAATTQFSYTFVGWNPAIAKVTGDATYEAKFTESVNKYTVTWIVDGVETKETYAYGETPVYNNGATPVKAADAQYTYTFDKWTPAVGTVTGDVTYTATFTSVLKKYTIAWQDETGKVVDTTQVAYGEMPAHADLTKAETAEFTYTFKGWSPEIVKVTGNATYKAVFEEVKKVYTVTWIVDGDEIEEIYVYGAIPVFKGTPVKEGDAEHEYEFDNWSPAIVAVTGDATYTAQFHEVIAYFPAGDDHEATFDMSEVPETIHTVIVHTDTWDMTIPDTIFREIPVGIEVSISMNVLPITDLPVELRSYATGKQIISLEMLVGGEEFSDFNGEKITVSFHFEPFEGMDVSKIAVWYMDEVNMVLEEYEATYDADKSVVTFETTHFSYWFVGTTEESDDPTNEVLITFIVIMVVLAFIALCAVMTRGKW